MTPNRQITENYIINSISSIDKDNGKKYKKLFKSFSDRMFNSYMETLRDEKTSLHIYLPNMIKSLTNKVIFEIAKRFKLILFDKLRFKNPITGKYYYTNYKYLILRLPIRRVKQYLFNKISLPESDKHVSKLSGQVMKPDKGAKISLIETYMLVNKKLEKSIIEFIKVRSGDIKVYNEFKFKLLENGIVSLSDLDLKDSQPKSVITTDSLLKGIHIETGLSLKDEGGAI